SNINSRQLLGNWPRRGSLEAFSPSQLGELQGGGHIDPSALTIADFLDRFERDWVAVHVSARTAERYGQLLGHVPRPLGSCQVQKLRSADIAALYATLSRSGSAPRTIGHIHGVLFQALKQAKVWNLLRDNVAEVVKPPFSLTGHVRYSMPCMAIRSISS